MISISLLLQADPEELYHRVLVTTTQHGEQSRLMDRYFTRVELTPVYLQKALTVVLSEAAHMGLFDPADLPD